MCGRLCVVAGAERASTFVRYKQCAELLYRQIRGVIRRCVDIMQCRAMPNLVASARWIAWGHGPMYARAYLVAGLRATPTQGYGCRECCCSTIV